MVIHGDDSQHVRCHSVNLSSNAFEFNNGGSGVCVTLFHECRRYQDTHIYRDVPTLSCMPFWAGLNYLIIIVIIYN